MYFNDSLYWGMNIFSRALTRRCVRRISRASRKTEFSTCASRATSSRDFTNRRITSSVLLRPSVRAKRTPNCAASNSMLGTGTPITERLLMLTVCSISTPQLCRRRPVMPLCTAACQSAS